MRLAFTILLTAVALVLSVVFWAWSREFQRRTRSRCVTANGALYRHLLGTDLRIDALYEALGYAYLEPVADDSPTDEITAQPATEPLPVTRTTDAVAARRSAAWDDPQQRPMPHKRSEETEWVERSVNIGGTVQTFRIRAARNP